MKPTFYFFGKYYKISEANIPPMVIILRYSPRKGKLVWVDTRILSERDVEEIVKFAEEVKKVWNKFKEGRKC